jgi:hypothetical protein
MSCARHRFGEQVEHRHDQPQANAASQPQPLAKKPAPAPSPVPGLRRIRRQDASGAPGRG